jgi:hypothetical protein
MQTGGTVFDVSPDAGKACNQHTMLCSLLCCGKEQAGNEQLAGGKGYQAAGDLPQPPHSPQTADTPAVTTVT